MKEVERGASHVLLNILHYNDNVEEMTFMMKSRID
jgi:hypothetical protein